MQVKIRKWGNSASIRIPAAIMASSALTLDQMVEIGSQDGRLIIEPVVAPTYDLDTLLAQMTPDTFHEEIDTGAPVGNEIW